MRAPRPARRSRAGARTCPAARTRPGSRSHAQRTSHVAVALPEVARAPRLGLRCGRRFRGRPRKSAAGRCHRGDGVYGNYNGQTGAAPAWWPALSGVGVLAAVLDCLAIQTAWRWIDGGVSSLADVATETCRPLSRPPKRGAQAWLRPGLSLRRAPVLRGGCGGMPMAC